MKTRTILLAVAALALLPSCSFPTEGDNEFDAGLARSLQAQPQAQAEASRAMAGVSRSSAPRRALAPLQPLPAL